MDTFARHFWANVRKTDDCWLWTGNSVHSSTDLMGRWSYGVMRIERSWYRAHRLSWELHNGAIPDGQWVLHRCDNTLCVRPDHLFLGNAKANTDDMVSKGRDNFWGGPEAPGRGRKPLPVIWRVCAHCQQKFIVKRNHKGALHCSNLCAQRGKKRVPLSAESLASFREKRGFKPQEARACRHCGKIFTPSRFHPQVVNCSRACSNRARAATA